MTVVGQPEPTTSTSDASAALGDIAIIINIMIGLQVAVNNATSLCGHIVLSTASRFVPWCAEWRRVLFGAGLEESRLSR